MLEKPDLADAALAGYVRDGWGLAGATVRFLPLGKDARAYAYEVRAADGTRWFAKLRAGRTGPATVLLPRYLYARGMTEVVAPVATVDGRPWYDAAAYQLLLYPFVAGTRPDALTDDQWVAYGAFLGALHATVPTAELTAVVPDEAYDCPGSAWLRELADLARSRRWTDPWRRALYRFWRDRDAEIAGLADHAERLGRLARDERRPHVLCHADAHTNNLLVDGHGRLHVVDWDEPVRAPRERDLMFVTWALTGARDEALFRSGYGPLDVNGPALAYYRYERLVSDLAEFAHQVFDRDDFGEESRRDGYGWFVRQFEPGGAVDEARAGQTGADLRLCS